MTIDNWGGVYLSAPLPISIDFSTKAFYDGYFLIVLNIGKVKVHCPAQHWSTILCNIRA
jgi:hypothetical protein